MTKKQKKLLNKVLITSALSIALIGVFTVSANLSFMDRIADKAGEILGLSLSDKIDIPVEGEMMGGSGGVFQTKWVKQGNRVTYIESGQFRNASTTIISFVNPFGIASTTAPYSGGSTATSTVVSVNLDITGVATSTYTVACGASSDIYADNTYSILSSGSVVTSTEAVIENNMTNSYSNGVTGGTVDKMALTPQNSYFVCKVTTDYEAAFTNDANTFDGSYSVEIRKNLQ